MKPKACFTQSLQLKKKRVSPQLSVQWSKTRKEKLVTEGCIADWKDATQHDSESLIACQSLPDKKSVAAYKSCRLWGEKILKPPMSNVMPKSKIDSNFQQLQS